MLHTGVDVMCAIEPPLENDLAVEHLNRAGGRHGKIL